MPDLTLTFVNPRLLDDLSFHPCVRLKRWEVKKERREFFRDENLLFRANVRCHLFHLMATFGWFRITSARRSLSFFFDRRRKTRLSTFQCDFCSDLHQTQHSIPRRWKWPIRIDGLSETNDGQTGSFIHFRFGFPLDLSISVGKRRDRMCDAEKRFEL